MAAALFFWKRVAVQRPALHDFGQRRWSAEALNLLLVLLRQLL
jgi:hypothetical protein